MKIKDTQALVLRKQIRWLHLNKKRLLVKEKHNRLGLRPHQRLWSLVMLYIKGVSIMVRLNYGHKKIIINIFVEYTTVLLVIQGDQP